MKGDALRFKKVAREVVEACQNTMSLHHITQAKLHATPMEVDPRDESMCSFASASDEGLGLDGSGDAVVNGVVMAKKDTKRPNGCCTMA
jgi:hypothetical protein